MSISKGFVDVTEDEVDEGPNIFDPPTLLAVIDVEFALRGAPETGVDDDVNEKGNGGL